MPDPRTQANLLVAGSARFSACERYRYELARTWNEGRPVLVFIMLNPSTADADVNDPTIERCVRRAQAAGYGAMRVVNLFAWRATDPRELKRQADPVGPENDAAILAACRDAQQVICGWGKHGALMGRQDRVVEMLETVGVPLFCLAVNSDGSPKHPLYVSYAAAPIHFRGIDPCLTR